MQINGIRTIKVLSLALDTVHTDRAVMHQDHTFRDRKSKPVPPVSLDLALSTR